jgi:oligopeptide transport system substrate-binding protein
VLHNLFSALVEFRSGWEIVPDVARSWDISKDGRKYTFYLRDDVFWSDGTQVTAEDFVYSWKRTLDPTINIQGEMAGLLYDIENAAAFHKGELSDPKDIGIRAIDDLTLEVTLEKPANYFLQILPLQFPVPKHVVEELGESWTNMEHLATNGAFQVASYEPKKFFNLIRNPTYHGEFPGNIENVECLLGNFHHTLEGLKMYERDEIDILQLWEATYHARHRFAEEYLSYPLPFLYYVSFHTGHPPFDDIRVRRAFVMAVDRVRLCQEFLDGFKYPAIGGFIPPTILGHSPDIGLPYDPLQARKLMSQAGYADGQGFPTVELFWDNSAMTTLKFLKSQWAENLNVEIEIITTDFDEVLTELGTRNLNYAAWQADYPDPHNFLCVAIQRTRSHWQNERFEHLIGEANSTINQRDRIRLYQEAEEILIEDAVVMPITYNVAHVLLKPWVNQQQTRLTPINKQVIIKPH